MRWTGCEIRALSEAHGNPTEFDRRSDEWLNFKFTKPVTFVPGRFVGTMDAVLMNIDARWAAHAWATLTSREREVADLIANGLTREAAAEALTVDPDTIRNHLSRVYQKLEIAHLESNQRIRLKEVRDAASLVPHSSDSSLPFELAVAGSVVGREHETSQIRAALVDPACRAIVLWGMHGIGKTYVAKTALFECLKEPEHFAKRAHVIDCDADDDVDILAELAVILGLPEPVGPDDRSDVAAEAIRTLSTAPYVVLIDGLERLVEGPPAADGEADRQFALRDRDLEEFFLSSVQTNGDSKLILTTTHLPRVFDLAPPGSVRFIGRTGARFEGLVEDDALELLGRYKTSLTRTEMQKVAWHYEGHPEAMMWVGNLIAGRLAGLDEVLEDASPTLQQRIEGLLGRIIDAVPPAEAHVLSALSLLRRPAGSRLLERVFSLSSSAEGSAWKAAASALFEKSLAQAVISRDESLYYLHALVRSPVRSRLTDAQTLHSAAALAYEELADELWDVRIEDAEDAGIESVYHYAACEERSDARRLTKRLLPALEATGKKYLKLRRFSEAIEALDEQIALLGAEAEKTGDHRLKRRYGVARFYRARVRQRVGPVDNQVLGDLESAVMHADHVAALHDYVRALDANGPQLLGDELAPRVRELARRVERLIATRGREPSSELALGLLALLWWEVAQASSDANEIRELLASVFHDIPLWAVPSYYRVAARVFMALGDSDHLRATKIEWYGRAQVFLTAGRAAYPRHGVLMGLAAALNLRVANVETDPNRAAALLAQAKTNLAEAQRARQPLLPGTKLDLERQMAAIEIAAARLQGNVGSLFDRIEHLAQQTMREQKTSSVRDSHVVTVAGQLLEIADKCGDEVERERALRYAWDILLPSVEAGSSDPRIYGRLSGIIRRLPEADVSPQISIVLSGLGKALARRPSDRLLKLRAELYRRRLERMGWNTDRSLMLRVLRAAETAAMEALALEPHDPYGHFHLAQIYSVAAFASSALEDYQRFAEMARAKFEDTLELEEIPPKFFLEYARFCRRTFQWNKGLEMFNRFTAVQAERYRVWREASLYLELVVGVLREDASFDQRIVATAADLGRQAIDGGSRAPRLFYAYARILHELGRNVERDVIWARIMDEPIDDAWTANSRGTFLKDCLGDRAAAIEAYEAGLILARGQNQVAEAVLLTNLGQVLSESTQPEDLIKAHEVLNKAKALSKGRYTFAAATLEELKKSPDFRAAIARRNIKVGAPHRSRSG